MTDKEILGLRLLGPARPISAKQLDEAEQREGLRLPPSFRSLLEGYGAGSLCDLFHLLDPTDESPHSGWRFFRKFMREDGLTFRREYQHWKRISDRTWE